MTKLGIQGRRVLKILHLILVGLWLGGAVTLNLMVFALGPAESGLQLYGYDLACRFVDNAIIVPAALGCLASGLLLSWLTPWGFFKHSWISVKWALTVTCIVIGIVVLGPPVESQPAISGTLGLGALDNAAYAANRTGTLVGGSALILTLLFLLVISVLKPWQKQQKSRLGSVNAAPC